MRKRYAVLGLSMILALALAVPALGGPTNPVASISASAKKIAQKALKKANSAQSTANSALSAAGAAQSDVNKVQGDVSKVQGEVKKAQTTASTAQTTANAAAAAAAAAQSAADAANANANNRIKDSHEVIGEASASDKVISKSSSASCASEDPVLGGGFFIGGSEANLVTVTSSDALIYGHGWFAAGSTISGTPTWSITAVAMCGDK